MAPRESRDKRTTWTAWALLLPIKIVIVVGVSMLTSIAVEWTGMALGWWSQPGAAHAAATLHGELGWIDSQFTRSLLVSQPVATAGWLIRGFYHAVFVAPGISGWIGAHAADGGGLAATIATYGHAAVDVSLVVLVRVVILVLTGPLFVMAALLGVVDGLVRRDLRRFGAGRESAFVYHYAKRLVSPIFVVGWMIYLSIPFSLYPDAFLVPCAACFGLAIWVATGSFKKYL